MLTTSNKTKIKDLFNPITNPGGGVTTAMLSVPSTDRSKLTVSGSPSLSNLFAPVSPAWKDFGSKFQIGPDGQLAPKTVQPPMGPVRPSAPVAPASTASAPAPVAPVAPVAPTAPASAQVPAQYMNPDGSMKTAEQVAAEIAETFKKTSGMADVGRLAGNEFGGEGKTFEQLQTEAALINNARNDIAVGETDPFKVGATSGVAYTPAELQAIEKAYSGIYDPAINSAFSKMQAKKDADAAAAKTASEIAADEREQKNQLIRMEKQFGYDKALKQTPTPGQSTTGIYGTGTYTPGENPIVDSWAKRIFDGSAKITDIPATDKGLRNAVVVALQASGNGLLGQPTTTELGLKAKESAEAILKKLETGEGTSAVGKSRIFGGSLAIPGSDKADFVIDFQNLKDTLSLDGTRYLKGQGAVSDAERALLASAVTKLNLSQSEEDFKATLQDIRDTLSGAKYAKQEEALAGDAGGLPATMVLNGQTLTLQPDGTYE